MMGNRHGASLRPSAGIAIRSIHRIGGGIQNRHEGYNAC
jgi:hypothetical protein